MRISPESLLDCSLAQLRPSDSVGHWFYTTNSSAPPPGLPLCLWFIRSPSPRSHRHTVLSSSSHNTQPHLLCSKTRSSKTSEVGANPESRLTLSTHQLFTFKFPLSYSSRWWGGLWEPTASCIRSLIKKVFRNLQCQMHSLKSPAYIYHQTNDPFKHSKGRSAGVDRWNIVYAFRMYSSTVIVQRAILFLILTPMFFFFPMASLQGSILYLMCVFLKKEMTTSVYCWCLCQVQLVGLVCLLPFLDQGFYLLCSWSWWPTGNTAFYSRGSPLNYNKKNMILIFHMVDKSSDSR